MTQWLRNLGKNEIGRILIGSIIGMLVIYKASTISMTHDESASYFYLIDSQIWRMLFDSNAWPNANNHVLNTIAFQVSNSIFGNSELSVRWLSVFSYVLLLIYALKSGKHFQKETSKWLVFTMLVANPYILDFYSLARGYALALSCSVMVLYHLALYIERETKKDLIIGCSALFIGTMSLFSNVILFPAILIPLTLYILAKHRKKTLSTMQVIKPISIMGSFSILTAALSTIPILALSKHDEFKWGTVSLMESFRNFMSNSSYGKPYAFNDYFMVGLITMMLLYALIKFVLHCQNLSYIKRNGLYFLASTSFIVLIGLMMLSKGIGDTYYPIDRKTILYLPWGAILISLAIDQMHSKVSSIASMILTLVFLIHLALAWRKDEVREWWYDRDTRAFVEMASEDCFQDHCTIGSAWFFHPTSQYYVTNKYKNKLIMGDYNKDIVSQPTYDYFICFVSDYDIIKEKYDVLYQNVEGRMLLKRKRG